MLQDDGWNWVFFEVKAGPAGSAGSSRLVGRSRETVSPPSSLTKSAVMSPSRFAETDDRPAEDTAMTQEIDAREKASQRKRILLVDDDPEIVESMRVALGAFGYEILVARDGNQGLNLADTQDPDLVILDMMMPKRSGFLVLERLRQTRKVPTRVIMITANEGNRHKAYAEMLGVDDYIRKPFPMDRLIESVQRLLG